MSDGYTAQADERSIDVWNDNHGRPWVMPVDGRGNPVSTIQPDGWQAPISPPWLKGLLTPPVNIITPVKGQGKRGRYLEIDYRKWKAMIRTATQQLKQREMQLAKKHATNHLDMIRNPTPEFLLERGASPFPSMQVIQMMQDGDPWVLGQTEEIPAWAEPLFSDMLYAVRAGGLLSPAHQEALEEAELRGHLAQFGGMAVPEHPTVQDVQRVAGMKAKPAAKVGPKIAPKAAKTPPLVPV